MREKKFIQSQRGDPLFPVVLCFSHCIASYHKLRGTKQQYFFNLTFFFFFGRQVSRVGDWILCSGSHQDKINMSARPEVLIWAWSLLLDSLMVVRIHFLVV